MGQWVGRRATVGRFNLDKGRLSRSNGMGISKQNRPPPPPPNPHPPTQPLLTLSAHNVTSNGLLGETLSDEEGRVQFSSLTQIVIAEKGKPAYCKRGESRCSV